MTHTLIITFAQRPVEALHLDVPSEQVSRVPDQIELLLPNSAPTAVQPIRYTFHKLAKFVPSTAAYDVIVYNSEKNVWRGSEREPLSVEWRDTATRTATIAFQSERLSPVYIKLNGKRYDPRTTKATLIKPGLYQREIQVDWMLDDGDVLPVPGVYYDYDNSKLDAISYQV